MQDDAETSWRQDSCWWWSAGDKVHRDQLAGQAVSYYGECSKQGKQQSHGDDTPKFGSLLTSELHSNMQNLQTLQNDSPVSARTPANFNQDSVHEQAAMPPMSLDGGNEEEFLQYWKLNRSPLITKKGWLQRAAHPQVNVERYWSHADTGTICWQLSSDDIACHQDQDLDELPKLGGEGPAWNLSAQRLKEILSSCQADSLGLCAHDLACRACAEYEQFEPRVLSWHDYQYITFWFFGGLKRDVEKDRSSKAFFTGNSGAARELFADDSFFHALATVVMERLPLMRIHPINLTYLVWTFSRAAVVVPKFMGAVGDHLCRHGLIPMLDRCSLGTIVWNFSKQGIRHELLFKVVATELCRPNRVRSLAPRNFQNVLIAYSRNQHFDSELADAMARGIPRLLDNHDPQLPKLHRNVLFSYTCKDGSEVLADAFRIGGLTVIAKAFQDLRVQALSVEQCMAAMLRYTLKSVGCSPIMLREPGDACSFIRQLGYIAEAGLLNIKPLLCPLDLSPIVDGAPEKVVNQMKAALRRAGVLSR